MVEKSIKKCYKCNQKTFEVKEYINGCYNHGIIKIKICKKCQPTINEEFDGYCGECSETSDDE